MFKNAILFLAMTSPAYAKTHHHVDTDGRPMMRQMYASVWKAAIMDMFAGNGPTHVELVKNTLVIANPNCDSNEARVALAETFGPYKAKLAEIDMKIRCESGVIASR